jgi:hypothetical protein
VCMGMGRGHSRARNSEAKNITELMATWAVEQCRCIVETVEFLVQQMAGVAQEQRGVFSCTDFVEGKCYMC